ncbi:MAG: TonB-dependent receptor plug domain-containing protein, partial [Gemmatimonadales bacterium]
MKCARASLRVGLALAASPWALLVPALGAQQDTARHSDTSVMRPLTANRAFGELGAAVTILDVDSLLREAPVHTLTELLTGRVPGVLVLASSGTIGAGSRILIRGANSFNGTSAPLLYV